MDKYVSIEDKDVFIANMYVSAVKKYEAYPIIYTYTRQAHNLRKMVFTGVKKILNFKKMMFLLSIDHCLSLI